ncbi:MAG: DDE-type integrase/transposase/recombinase [Eubacteriales bacterium]|nr:DDE-type integrase/transposase/recombinase [Eubacteriales bacterium]
MIRDDMIDEIQELKLCGFTLRETYEELRRRHTKVPTEKTVRKYYNMDAAPADNHAAVRKDMAFAREPFASAIADILELNPGCYVSSVYDVLVERFVETGGVPAMPGNEQTLRNYVRHLRETGQVEDAGRRRRTYDVIDTPPPGEKAQVDFGQWDCGGGLTAHFVCILLWHSRLLWVCAQDHRFDSEEACRAIHRFTCRVGGRVRTLVIDQDSVFVASEVYGEVFETERFGEFLREQDMGLWVCRKADPESKGCVENSVKFVKSSFLSARSFDGIDDLQRRLPAWLDRANSRIHQGTYQVPGEVFERVERAALRPLLPSVYEAAPTDLAEAPVGGQPYVLHKAVKYSVPWEMCYTTAYKRVVGDRLHVYDARKRHVCTHEICPVRGSFRRLDEHRRQPASDWLDTAERMREKWNCTEFQHFVNGFKKENPERHLGRQLAAVERYLDERRPSRSLAAEAMAECCRKYRYTFTQFKAVFDLLAAGAAEVVGAGAADVDSRPLDAYSRAFEERCAS